MTCTVIVQSTQEMYIHIQKYITKQSYLQAFQKQQQLSCVMNGRATR